MYGNKAKVTVIPVFKTDDPSDVKKYRPIAVLSTLGKAMEENEHFFNFLRPLMVQSDLY